MNIPKNCKKGSSEFETWFGIHMYLDVMNGNICILVIKIIDQKRTFERVRQVDLNDKRF